MVAQLEIVSSKVSLRWRLKKFRPWEVNATAEYVVGKDEVSTKPATPERKDIQSKKPVPLCLLSPSFDNASSLALYELHQGNVSS